MADIFGYDKKVTTGVSAASAVKVSIDSNSLMLAQSVRVTYQRSVTPVYEVGSENVYMTAGRSSGTCEFDHLVGAGNAFLKAFEPSSEKASCEGGTITLQANDDACGAEAGTVTMTNCVLTNVGLSVTSQDITVHDSANYTIGSLSLS